MASAPSLAYMKPIPSSQQEMMAEARSLGLLDMDMKERIKNANTPRGKLLSHAYKSHQASRSCNHTSMMLLGKLQIVRYNKE